MLCQPSLIHQTCQQGTLRNAILFTQLLQPFDCFFGRPVGHSCFHTPLFTLCHSDCQYDCHHHFVPPYYYGGLTCSDMTIRQGACFLDRPDRNATSDITHVKSFCWSLPKGVEPQFLHALGPLQQSPDGPALDTSLLVTCKNALLGGQPMAVTTPQWDRFRCRVVSSPVPSMLDVTPPNTASSGFLGVTRYIGFSPL